MNDLTIPQTQRQLATLVFELATKLSTKSYKNTRHQMIDAQIIGKAATAWLGLCSASVDADIALSMEQSEIKD